jgi:hypothetical protein
VYESKECIDEISKIMTNGQIKRIGKPRTDECGSPPCRSFKVKHNFHTILKTYSECDSNIVNLRALS